MALHQGGTISELKKLYHLQVVLLLLYRMKFLEQASLHKRLNHLLTIGIYSNQRAKSLAIIFLSFDWVWKSFDYLTLSFNCGNFKGCSSRIFFISLSFCCYRCLVDEVKSPTVSAKLIGTILRGVKETYVYLILLGDLTNVLCRIESEVSYLFRVGSSYLSMTEMLRCSKVCKACFCRSI